MILSEYGAISSAIADGGFNLYPAGKLIDIIKAGLSNDDLKADFDPKATVEKIKGVPGPDDAAAKAIFMLDLNLLCGRLSEMDASYDIEAVFDKMITAMPAMARRYYGIDNFEAPRPKVVEYYFEGFNELYKDADWSAFNVNSMEAVELKVPFGTYFKRSRIAPGYPEFVTFHEANHAMQEIAALPKEYHHYIPWFDEGFADILGRMMLFRATGNEMMFAKLKNFRTEVDVLDARKVTYHYGDETAALILLRGRLPFAKALMAVRKRETFAVDWDSFALKVRAGWDPHIALVAAHTGKKQDAFRKRVERDEAAFRKNADLDQSDLKILGMFMATQPPACIDASEYKAALWMTGEAKKYPNPHYVDPHAIPEDMRGGINGFTVDAPVKASEIPAHVWEKAPQISVKIVIREEDVPTEFKESAATIAANYFIIKRKIGEATIFEPYGGGLPYRLATGELRCTY